jgi:uncharacterized protein Usg
MRFTPRDNRSRIRDSHHVPVTARQALRTDRSDRATTLQAHLQEHGPSQMENDMVSQDFRRQLEGYGLTTAEIVYRRPDHPWLLQTYLWQDYDVFPNFPTLERFLAFWKKNLDGALHSVRVAHSRLIRPAEIRAVDGVFRLH